MGAEHSPGPWSEGQEGSLRVYGPDGMGEHSGLIANVFKGRANVRLIAAAPDLLDACDFALSILEALGNGKGDAANACRAAIAKACAIGGGNREAGQ